METCFRCGRTEEEVKLFDGVNITETVRACEKCSLIESIPLLKNPSTDQLKSSEKTDHVYKRLKTIAGLKDVRQEKSVFEQIQELDENPKLEKPDEKPVQFVENFHWAIQRERRRKGMTPEHLAQSIGESSSAIRLIERNNLPENAVPVIKKIEQFFRIKLIESEESSIKQPTTSVQEKEGAMKVLSFKEDKMSNITISDLREMQRVVEKDFPNKTSKQIGEEQLADFGKSDQKEEVSSDNFDPKSWSKAYFKKREEKKAGISSGIIPSFQKAVEQIGGGEVEEVPSISDLAEQKGIRPSHDSAEKIVGNEIELVEEEKESPVVQSQEEVLGDEIEIIDALDLDKPGS